MHIVAILLFPIRVVTWPIIVPPITGIMYGLTSWQPPTASESYWHLLGATTKAWLLWHV